jgi:eukaryotic-like serine/threonine-protein kinase
MTAERWKKIDETVDAALELPEAERERFISAECGSDEDLQREVLNLLDAQNETLAFMENSAMNLMAKEIAGEHSADFSFIGSNFGNYKIEKSIGAGGMGEVYLAQDTRLNRKVALKILPPEFAADTERIKRFKREAQAVSALNHPYIVTVYEVGEVDGTNFIATEFVEGKTIRELINEGVDLKQTLSIISQTAEALTAAHNAGIIHRDIKPENILIRSDGYVKVLDFGLAKSISSIENSPQNLSNYTQKGMIIGTIAYMSPAQAIGDNVDNRTDLWSLGVVLYELLTGVNPFKKENRQATFNAVLTENPPKVSSINSSLPPELDAVLSKVFEKDPDLSYQTALDFRVDLKRIRREIDSSSSLKSAELISSRSRKKTIRQKFLPWSFAALCLLLPAFGGWYFWNNSNADKSPAVEWANAKNLQLTYSNGLVGYPSLSPDGKTFVYASIVNGKRDIYAQRLGGKNEVNLTKNFKKDSTMPAYSPDGKLIAFRSDDQGGGIFLMEETGENVKKIADFGFHPSWSPDGKKIVVSDKAAAVHTAHFTPNSSLSIIDIASGEKNTVDTKGDAIMPSWSPNGKRIAYWFIGNGKLSEIATVPVDGGEPEIITNDNFSDWNPVWSPDGRYVYFAGDRSGNMNFWRIAVDENTGKVSGVPELVATPSKYCRHITFSRNGKQMVYIRYESKSNLQTLSFDEKAEKVIGQPNFITRGNREITHPRLSPNGEEYIFRTLNQTNEDLSIVSKDGKVWRNLTDDTFVDRNPVWSPDGNKVFFGSSRNGKQQIWSINRDGTNPQQITFEENIGAVFPVISPDGSRLAYNKQVDKIQIAVIIDLNKNWNEQTPQPLMIPKDFDGYFAVRDWSKDGKSLLVSSFEKDGDESGIGIYSLLTNTYTKITEDGEYPNWLNDNQRFIFNKDDKIYLGNSVTKKITELYSPPSYQIQQPSISADNKLISYRYLQIDSEVWLLNAE